MIVFVGYKSLPHPLPPLQLKPLLTLLTLFCPLLLSTLLAHSLAQPYAHLSLPSQTPCPLSKWSGAVQRCIWLNQFSSQKPNVSLIYKSTTSLPKKQYLKEEEGLLVVSEPTKTNTNNELFLANNQPTSHNTSFPPPVIQRLPTATAAIPQESSPWRTCQ